MKLNYNRILNNDDDDDTSLRSSFNALRENYSAISAIEYINNVRHLPLDYILENSQYVFPEPLSGTGFFKYILENQTLTGYELEDQKNKINSLISKLNSNTDPNEIKALKECINIIDRRISYIENNKKDHILNQYMIRKMSPMIESSAKNTLDDIIHNIPINNEYQHKYKKFVNSMKSERVESIIKNIPLIIIKNSVLLIAVSSATLSLIILTAVTLPSVIVGKIIDSKINSNRIKSYIKIFNHEIDKLYKYSESEDLSAEKKKLLLQYIESLENARDELQTSIISNTKVTESCEEYVLEGAVTFILPMILPVPKKWIRAVMLTGWKGGMKLVESDIEKIKSVKKLDEYIDNLKASRQKYRNLKKTKNVFKVTGKYLLFNGVNADKQLDVMIEIHDKTIAKLERRKHSLQVAREALSEIDDDFDDLFNDDENFDDLTDDNDDLLMIDSNTDEDDDELRDNYLESFLDFVFNDSNGKDTVCMESFTNFVRIDTLLESRKVVNAIRKKGEAVKKVATKARKATEPINNAVNNLLDSIKKSDENERRNRIIEGSFRFKLLKIIRDGILIGGVALIHPAIAAIGIITRVALDSKADAKARRKILNELKLELKMVDEKLEDAKSDNDRKKKYELMRIKSKLEKDIDRIEFKLDK